MHSTYQNYNIAPKIIKKAWDLSELWTYEEMGCVGTWKKNHGGFIDIYRRIGILNSSENLKNYMKNPLGWGKMLGFFN